MDQYREQLGLTPMDISAETTGDKNAVSSRRSLISRTALALLMAASFESSGCAADEFTVAPGPDDDAGDAAETGEADAVLEASADGSNDSMPSADGADGDAALMCKSSGKVVFDSSMGCYKFGDYRGSSFLAFPNSSENTKTCQSGTCATDEMKGDIVALWVSELKNNGKFASADVPAGYQARCDYTHTAATPPNMSDIQAEMAMPTGWLTPTVNNIGINYTVSTTSCPGSSVLYLMNY